ncbi:MAG: flagellar basal body P-ring formation chaperone FlgA [Nitrospinota bacterium]
MSYELRVRSQKIEVRSQKPEVRKLLFYLLSSVFCLLFLQPLAFGLQPFNKVAINVMNTPSVEGDMIHLKDIAEIKGNRGDVINKLKEIVIGFSPPQGESQIITEDFLRLCIKRAKLGVEDIELNSPPQINVSRKYYEVTPEQLKAMIQDFIEKRKVTDEGRVIIDNLNFDGRVFLSSPDFRYEIGSNSSLSSTGRISLTITFKENERIQKTIHPTMDLKFIMPSVVAIRSIKRGELISDKDIKIEDREVNRDTSQIVSEPENIIGKQAKVDIKKGDFITVNIVEIITVVNLGDAVNIVAESDVLRVTVRGVVKEKGGKGELVKVLNVSSNKIIHAKVVDSHTVKVEF